MRRCRSLADTKPLFRCQPNQEGEEIENNLKSGNFQEESSIPSTWHPSTHNIMAREERFCASKLFKLGF